MKNKKHNLAKELQLKEKQIATAEKEAAALRKKIEAEKKASQPKSIMDIVNSFVDACKYKKVKPSSIFNSCDTPDEAAYKKLKFTIAVLNEGWTPKKGEYRYYPYFNVSSGFVFNNAFYGVACAYTASASRLCSKTRELAAHQGKILLQEWKAFIM